MPGLRMLLIMLAFAVPSAGVVLLVAWFTRKRAWPKYIPAAVLLLLTVWLVVMAQAAQGMEGLGYIIIALLAFGAFVFTLLAAVGVDIYRAIKRRRGSAASAAMQPPFQPQPFDGQAGPAREAVPPEAAPPLEERPGENPPESAGENEEK